MTNTQELPKLDDSGNPVVSWLLIDIPGTLTVPPMTMRVPVYLELPPVRPVGSLAIVSKVVYVSLDGEWMALNS